MSDHRRFKVKVQDSTIFSQVRETLQQKAHILVENEPRCYFSVDGLSEDTKEELSNIGALVIEDTVMDMD